MLAGRWNSTEIMSKLLTLEQMVESATRAGAKITMSLRPINRKKIHKAAKIAPGGLVSALCFKKPHPINMKLETWTLRREAVTCPKCKKILAAA